MSRHFNHASPADDARWQRSAPAVGCRSCGPATPTMRWRPPGLPGRLGASVVELTYSTPGVLEAVTELVADGLVVGVGTVRTPDQVSEAVGAGASFVVSFHRPAGFLEAAAESGVLAIPGALTPHEVAAAVDDGARAVKMFPARLVTPAYLADLRAVLGPVPLMVTGGIPATREGLEAWLVAGAMCVGVGSQLGSAAVDGAEEITGRAAALFGPRVGGPGDLRPGGGPHPGSV